MKAEILSIGTEILLGEITDTNATYIASQLPLLGINLYWVTQVGDNQTRIVETLRRALDRSDLIIATGGLGPTEDDLTRESIAESLGEQMKVDPELEIWLREMFRKSNMEMPERNLKQTTLIPSARAIRNWRGSAPGWWVENKDKIIIAMPGPPSEMQPMWTTEVAPELRTRAGDSIIVSRTLKTGGLSEGKVDEMVSSLLSSSNPSIGVYAKPDGIQLRLTAKAHDQRQAREMLDPLEAKVRAILGRYIWGKDDDTLEGAIGAMLKEKHLTLALMESCTGGLLASAITEAPGSSVYFKGGIVAYSAEAKIACGIDPELIAREGTVSPDTAAAMARAARERLGADIGIGVTGVAGPSQIEGKPVGTVHISIDFRGQTRTVSAIYQPQRQIVRRRSVLTAFLELRKILLDSQSP